MSADIDKLTTFKQWRAQRVWAADLATAMQVEPDEFVAGPGWVYPSGYINERGSHEPGKRYYLFIERDEWEANDLHELEPTLWEWVRTEWCGQDELPVEALAMEFAQLLRQWLSPTEWVEMTKRNSAAQGASTCASHDFCDANMAMAEAFLNTTGRELFPEGDASLQQERDTYLVNAAWTMARKSHLAKVEG